jgi:hypothetical protein
MSSVAPVRLKEKTVFNRSKTERIKESVVSASELATQLAQDKKFRKRLLSAIEHGSEVGRRTRRGLGVTGVIRRLSTDEGLLAELKSARNDLQRAYARAEKTRRSHKLRKFMFFAALASIAGVPQLRDRVTGKAKNYREPVVDFANQKIGGAPRERQSPPNSLEDLTKEELYARAQDADVPGRSEMSKEQLISALRARS